MGLPRRSAGLSWESREEPYGPAPASGSRCPGVALRFGDSAMDSTVPRAPHTVLRPGVR